MKIALASICSFLCLVFALSWVALVLYANGMGSFSGNYPWGVFTKFWVVAAVVLAIIGAVVVWFPLSTVAKISLLCSLIGISFASLLIDNIGAFGKSTIQNKMPEMLLGSIPIVFLLLTWIADFLINIKQSGKLKDRFEDP